eukprot:gene11344-biopygen2659
MPIPLEEKPPLLGPSCFETATVLGCTLASPGLYSPPGFLLGCPGLGQPRLLDSGITRDPSWCLRCCPFLCAAIAWGVPPCQPPSSLPTPPLNPRTSHPFALPRLMPDHRDVTSPS